MLEMGREHDEVVKLAFESNLPTEEAIKKFGELQNTSDMKLLNKIDIHEEIVRFKSHLRKWLYLFLTACLTLTGY